MTEIPAKPVMFTGASGKLGRQMVKFLADAGWSLRLTDIVPFPDELPPRATFVAADLNSGTDIMSVAEGCGMIIHFGGIPNEQPFEDVLGPNLRGLYHVYEAARRERVRVMFTSSNHSIGFHARDALLDDDCQFLPDGYYGLSKAYGELMGRLYWYKHGIENVNVRIGSCVQAPRNARELSLWISPRDLAQLCIRATLATSTGHCVVWGASNNRLSWWRLDAREKLGWQPQDSADSHIPQLAEKLSGDPIEDLYQGGMFTRKDYTRGSLPPKKLFG